MTQTAQRKVGVYVLIAINVMAAIGLIYTTHLVRQSTSELQALREQSYQLDAEYGRLLLEASSIGSHARVEDMAIRELGMQVPKGSQVVVIEVKP